jgi:hypothetical protein
MFSIKETANKFFADCESGKGWQTCKDYCSANATFSSHASSLEGVETVEAYADWMKGVCQMLPDCSYELKATTVDEEAGCISFFAVFFWHAHGRRWTCTADRKARRGRLCLRLRILRRQNPAFNEDMEPSPL